MHRVLVTGRPLFIFFQILNELQDLDVGNIGATKGNSLFSEVEDRRVKVCKSLNIIEV